MVVKWLSFPQNIPAFEVMVRHLFAMKETHGLGNLKHYLNCLKKGEWMD
jgi:hypothetical protein